MKPGGTGYRVLFIKRTFLPWMVIDEFYQRPCHVTLGSNVIKLHSALERKPCTSYQTYFSFPSPPPFPRACARGKIRLACETNEEHGNSVKISITCITPVLQAILDFFPDIISFQHVFHLGVGRSQIEWKLKATTQILVFP